MKNLTSYAVAIVTSLVMMSCSTNETLDVQPQNIVNSYSLERNASGEYYLNTTKPADIVVNQANKTTEVYALEAGVAKQSATNLLFNDGKLKVDFVQDFNTPSITIFDDAETKEINYLNTYKISANEDGTYQVDFSVNKGIAVEFVYNEKTDVYEIHLAQGKQTQSSFTKVFDVQKGDVLKVNFVNHLKSNNFAKGATDPYKKEKPRSIILT